MKIIYPGMSRDRLLMALRTVLQHAEENSCCCDKTKAGNHRPGCWVYMARSDFRIVENLIERLQKEKSDLDTLRAIAPGLVESVLGPEKKGGAK